MAEVADSFLEFGADVAGMAKVFFDGVGTGDFFIGPKKPSRRAVGSFMSGKGTSSCVG